MTTMTVAAVRNMVRTNLEELIGPKENYPGLDENQFTNAINRAEWVLKRLPDYVAMPSIMGINPIGAYMTWADDHANLRCTIRFPFKQMEVHLIHEDLTTAARQDIRFDPFSSTQLPEEFITLVCLTQPPEVAWRH